MRATIVATAIAAATLGSMRVRADAAPLQFEVVQPDSLASAMMMGLINQDNVLILDKVENNPTKIDGTPVRGSILKLSDYSVRGVQVNSNAFCASGLTLGNGTWLVAGGNNAVGVGGAAAEAGDGPYYNSDGRLAIRLLDPNVSDEELQWDDNGNNMMQTPRWYPGIEGLADGSVVLLGGMVNGGYINRNVPNVDPAYEGGGDGSPDNLNGGANPTFEYWPPKRGSLKESKFMIKTSGLNTYAHSYLLPSGRIFLQANYSTTIWDHESNDEEDLPDMPDQIVRVYPASGAAAMLPMTKENNYTAPILFCGGARLDDQTWGDYAGPGGNILNTAASDDCSSILPELADGTTNPDAAYDREEKMPQGRTMGQFIHLPTGQMLIVNGAEKGTAGYYNKTFNQVTVRGNTINTEGLAQGPAYTPLMYDPSKPKGQRLSNAGFGASQIARLYHSSAMLVPDGSVLIGGSNPHVDVVLDMPRGTNPQAFNTTYEIEAWYPDYFFETRPAPDGLPASLGYGGSPFNFTLNASFMGSNANYKAANTKVMLIRPGFSTHAMNMGQRSMQLESTYTVADDGTTSFMVNQLPTNVNLFVPGPALLFVTVDGVPSIGKFVMVGDLTGRVPNQVTVGAALVDLPASVESTKSSSSSSGSGGSGNGAATQSASASLVSAIISLCTIATLVTLAL